MRKITSLMRKAIENYKMIKDGDKIAVGLSGGKDSLTLATALKYYQRYSPQKFELVAIIIDLFNGKTDYANLLEHCEKIGLETVIIKSRIFDVVFKHRQESNPCSLCSKLRRGILNTEAKKLGCNKIALGHHQDDVIETFFLSMFFEGRLSTFHPVTYLNDADMHVIRPFFYVTENSIIGYAKNLPVIHNCCPADKNTKREYVKDLLKNISHEIPFAKQRIHSALMHSERNNLIPALEENIIAHNAKKEKKQAEREMKKQQNNSDKPVAN